MKPYYLTVKQVYDNYEGLCSQRVINDKNDTLFRVYNMCHCPEDATISRDLFDATDFIDAIKLGMKLYSMGYNEIIYNVESEESDDE